MHIPVIQPIALCGTILRVTNGISVWLLTLVLECLKPLMMSVNIDWLLIWVTFRIRIPGYYRYHDNGLKARANSSGGASFIEWGGQRGPRHFRGGASLYGCQYSIIPSSPPFPLISLFSLLLMVPFLSISLSFPSPVLPSFDTASGLGSAVSSPAGPGGARLPNAIWWILGLEMSVF